VERRVRDRTEAGLSPLSVVAATGLPLTEEYRRGIDAGITVHGTTVVRDPRVQLVGYGPSASTLGATRAGRTAALTALKTLEADRQQAS